MPNENNKNSNDDSVHLSIDIDNTEFYLFACTWENTHSSLYFDLRNGLQSQLAFLWQLSLVRQIEKGKHKRICFIVVTHWSWNYLFLQTSRIYWAKFLQLIRIIFDLNTTSKVRKSYLVKLLS